MSPKPRISGAAAVILAGGAGRRMGGRVKPLLTAEGRPILERQLDCLGPLFGAIALSANDPEPFAAYSLPILADPISDGGPLAGIAAALAWCPERHLFVVAGDMPFLEPAAIELLAARLHQPGAPVQAVAPFDGERAEPLHAFYARSIVPLVTARLAVGERAVHGLFSPDAGLTAVRVPVAELAAVVPATAAARFLSSWNRPQDCQ